MNTLSANSIPELLRSWPEFRSLTAALADGRPPSADVEGAQGCLYGYIISEYCALSSARRAQAARYAAAGCRAGGGQDAGLPPPASDLVIVVPGEREAAALQTDLRTVFSGADILTLPWWGSVPYRPVASGSVVFGQRAGALAKLAASCGADTEQAENGAARFRAENDGRAVCVRGAENGRADSGRHSAGGAKSACGAGGELCTGGRPRVFVMTQRAAQTPVPPPEYIRSLVFTLKKGQPVDTVKTAERLAALGYIRVPRVGLRGEFSVRGEVLDIFPPDAELPVRIVFDFTDIETIRTFDPENQATVESVESVTVCPMKEVLWTQELTETLRDRLTVYQEECRDETRPRLPFTEEAEKNAARMLSELSGRGQCEGEEFFYPALWDRPYSVFDYIGRDTAVFLLDYDRMENAQESLEREYTGMYRKARLDLPVFAPQDTLFDFHAVTDSLERCIKFHTISSEKHSDFMHISCEPAQSYFGNIVYLKDELKKLTADGWRIVIFADNDNQALRIQELLREFTGQDGETENPVLIVGKAVSGGFAVPAVRLRVIQENEIFGRRKYAPKSLRRAKSRAIDTFVELNPGDYVVHVNYGIGIFCGIERVRAAGHERDYIKLEYADKEYVFVPIEQVNLVQRYIGSEGSAPCIDRIGSKSWENRKNKVRKSVEEIAAHLIDLYSRRKATRGFPFPRDTEWQTMFEAAFPYEDTPDQVTVTAEVKRDMERPVPMDRLICGDVGYGKTEIAMRAAFKAVMGGKQVAFLAPTTILAEQHYETCAERFRNFPVRIAQLSRFVPPAEQKKVLANLADGRIDILIGTHRIIQKDVVFKNLGLMIVDEEQRFGVKDKERLKVMKNSIDCLAMSATPIPRTLHMSLLKIRDMSLLTTPPQNRQPIENIIEAYSDDRVVSAIRREVERGGQIFYLHNRVETLNETRSRLERLLPEMLIDVAHGQMASEQLDDIFRRFKMGGFHVLVSTTIIENGIDIPNVNTVIIDRADMYGVSQLYQLRGRVGRNDRKAYAYFLYPENRSLSEIAMKRLQVISDFAELGSGFKIAMKDMEIRGAGNLLGRDQSGNVYSVGFELYVRLLNEAVERLTARKDFAEQNEALLELEYTGFIPDSYVQNPQTKMEIYKKISSVVTDEDLDAVYAELTDRFGPVPDEVSSLLALSEIRILCRKLSISSIKERKGVIQAEFAKVSDISVDKILNLIRESAGTVRLDAGKPNMIFFNLGNIGLKEKSEFIREKLEKIV